MKNYQIPKNHAAMHRAVLEARKTVGKCITVLKHPAGAARSEGIRQYVCNNPR